MSSSTLQWSRVLRRRRMLHKLKYKIHRLQNKFFLKHLFALMCDSKRIGNWTFKSFAVGVFWICWRLSKIFCWKNPTEAKNLWFWKGFFWWCCHNFLHPDVAIALYMCSTYQQCYVDECSWFFTTIQTFMLKTQKILINHCLAFLFL